MACVTQGSFPLSAPAYTSYTLSTGSARVLTSFVGSTCILIWKIDQLDGIQSMTFKYRRVDERCRSCSKEFWRIWKSSVPHNRCIYWLSAQNAHFKWWYCHLPVINQAWKEKRIVANDGHLFDVHQWWNADLAKDLIRQWAKPIGRNTFDYRKLENTTSCERKWRPTATFSDLEDNFGKIRLNWPTFSVRRLKNGQVAAAGTSQRLVNV